MIDESSTAGIGVISTPIVAMLVVAIGVGADRLLRVTWRTGRVRRRV